MQKLLLEYMNLIFTMLENISIGGALKKNLEWPRQFVKKWYQY